MWQREGHVARRWGGRTRGRMLALTLLTVGLGVALAACSGSPSGTTSATATTTTSGGTTTPGATTNNTPPAGFPTPTVTPNGGGVQRGVDDVCAQTPNVSKQPPSNLPIYPNAQLVQGNTTQNNGQNVGLFDFCTSAATPDAVVTFYTTQLPGQGWQNIQTYTGTDAKSVLAKQGNEQLTVTALVDSANPATPTEILVTINGLPA